MELEILEIIDLIIIIALSFSAGIVFPIYWESFKRTFILKNEENFEKDKEEIEELKKENEIKEKILGELRLENGELTVELFEIKKIILQEKGYIGEFVTFFGMSGEPSPYYEFYVSDLKKLKVKQKTGTLKEVYRLDQKGKIFPNVELAEKSLLDRLEKEDKAKEELKKKYKEDK